jgi:hypothetical protein
VHRLAIAVLASTRLIECAATRSGWKGRVAGSSGFVVRDVDLANVGPLYDDRDHSLVSIEDVGEFAFDMEADLGDPIDGQGGAVHEVDDLIFLRVYAHSFEAALKTLHDGLPNAHVFVSSIPNLYQLWQVLHANWLARAVWAYSGICPAMLSSVNTEADRQQVVVREVEFNEVLADVCAAYVNYCRWDGGAVYQYPFSASDVSQLDYFHPSLSGQAALANVTWSTSWWST